MAGTFTVVSSDAEDGAIVSTYYNGVNYQATVASSVAVIEIPTADLVETNSSSSTILLTAAGGTDTETSELYSYQIPVSDDWISTTFGASSSSIIDASTSYAIQRDHRYRYRVTGTTTDLYTVEDTSTNFATHSLNLTGLTADTEYQIWPQSRDDASSPWVDMAGPFVESTIAVAATTSVLFTVHDAPTTHPTEDRTTYGAFAGTNGATIPPSGNTNFTRNIIEAGSHYGAARRFNLPAGVTEAWFSHWIQLGSNWSTLPSLNCKLGGPSSQLTGDQLTGTFAGTHVGGQGNQGGGFAKSWSERHILQVGDGGVGFTPFGIGVTHYDEASTSAAFNKWWGTASPNTFGSPRQDEVGLVIGQWHRLEHYIKLNDSGSNNGVAESWFDGTLAYSRTGIGFSDEAEFLNLAYWHDIFHGGTSVSPVTVDVFTDDYRYSTTGRVA